MILKPISIAPRDGTSILALSHNALEEVKFIRVRWSKDAWRINDSQVALPHGESFTLWMDNVIEVEPLLLVPLGPNRFRDGTPCRVVCNDCKGLVPVLVLVGSHSEAATYRWANGTVNEGKESPQDLVGHLPPKPREVWIKTLHKNCIDWELENASNSRDYKLFREVVTDESV
jgi:hypothetical protein